ncbi:hypothetical protein BC629DRAFT_781242 [Irpex lacteus]|nr:hypothetical protein BC629DRAFT_781242 [Irpex lacteus]
MASASNSSVTLPSINEMFPEHMMHGLYDGRRDYSISSSAAIVKREPTPDYPRPSATPRPSRPITHVAHSITAQHPEHYPRQNASQPSQNYRNQRGPIPDSSHSYAAIPHRSADSIRLQTSQPYSFDLLKPNSSTSSLDTIATSHNVAYQPRPASSVYHLAGRGNSSQDRSSEASRSRPILHVDPPAAPRGVPGLGWLHGRRSRHFPPCRRIS